ncbi:hypothetical protein [Moorena sp. SIO4G3]|uniref:hypothetical protein n=1 Tax=Moorena sp. SIO4G3 TaxID=2607821 RepID=UPI00142AB713|nr:hypothetical protein [Moorena sp. SIO4G3]NEO82306.1 hypothetical protein [Moorena sp. SIO4G3]
MNHGKKKDIYRFALGCKYTYFGKRQKARGKRQEAPTPNPSQEGKDIWSFVGQSKKTS